jgi:hypothetical protein
MCAWKESLVIGDEVLLLSDGNGELAHAMGVELDLSNNPVGLDVRSRRYALLAEDGVVKVLNLEEGSTPAPAHAWLPSPGARWRTGGRRLAEETKKGTVEKRGGGICDFFQRRSVR